MIADTLVNTVLDWWLFLVLFFGIPVALILRVLGWVRSHSRSRAEEAASELRVTKDDTGAGYRRERREAMRHG